MKTNSKLDELLGSKRGVANSAVCGPWVMRKIKKVFKCCREERSYQINIEPGANIQIVFIDKLEEIEDLIVDNHGNIK
jgi:hypothetical protein